MAGHYGHVSLGVQRQEVDLRHIWDGVVQQRQIDCYLFDQLLVALRRSAEELHQPVQHAHDAAEQQPEAGAELPEPTIIGRCVVFNLLEQRLGYGNVQQ